MRYIFEWDTAKATTNSGKHRVAFEEAATVFLDPAMLSIYDEEHSDSEDRWITLGISSRARLLVVCHTFRKDAETSAAIRIFSARKASKLEEGQYREGCK